MDFSHSLNKRSDHWLKAGALLIYSHLFQVLLAHLLKFQMNQVKDQNRQIQMVYLRHQRQMDFLHPQCHLQALLLQVFLLKVNLNL